jgi:hypothetical protein
LSSILLLVLAVGSACSGDDDDFARSDDDDSTLDLSDDDDAGHGDDDDAGHGDDDGGHGDDDDDSETCARVEGSIDLPQNPPGTTGPLIIGVFDPADDFPGLTLANAMDSMLVEGESFPVEFSLCGRIGDVVVHFVLDTNDGVVCTAGDLRATAEATLAEGTVDDTGLVTLSTTVEGGDCEREGKNPDP